MNRFIQCKPTILPPFIAGVLACFGLLPKTLAVVPPPDGGYPGFNTAEGQNALFSLTTGVGNAAVGWYSLFSNTEGSFNTALGTGTLLFNVGDQSSGEGTENTAIGTAALLSNSTGFQNTAVGLSALQNNIGGNRNTAVGLRALTNNTTGSNNIAVGSVALFSNTTGNANTAVGASALLNNTSGTSNVVLGNHAGDGITGGTNIIAIGQVAGVSVGGQLDNSCYIDNIKDAQIDGTTASAVMVDQDGKLGTTVFSSQRFKKEIRPMGQTSEAVLALKPVTFRYKYDKKDALQFGLIAEEVAAVNPDLVVRDKNGQALAIRYDAVNAMLLNEFLKEHRAVQDLKSTVAKQQATVAQQDRKIQEQGITIAQLQAGMETVVTRLKKHESEIQKVSDQNRPIGSVLRLVASDQ